MCSSPSYFVLPRVIYVDPCNMIFKASFEICGFYWQSEPRIRFASRVNRWD